MVTHVELFAQRRRRSALQYLPIEIPNTEASNGASELSARTTTKDIGPDDAMAQREGGSSCGCL